MDFNESTNGEPNDEDDLERLQSGRKPREPGDEELAHFLSEVKSLYAKAPDERTARTHLAAVIKAAERTAAEEPAPLASPSPVAGGRLARPRRRLAVLIAALVLGSLLLLAALAVAGVDLPGVARAPFDHFEIQLPSQASADSIGDIIPADRIGQRSHGDVSTGHPFARRTFASADQGAAQGRAFGEQTSQAAAFGLGQAQSPTPGPPQATPDDGPHSAATFGLGQAQSPTPGPPQATPDDGPHSAAAQSYASIGAPQSSSPQSYPSSGAPQAQTGRPIPKQESQPSQQIGQQQSQTGQALGQAESYAGQATAGQQSQASQQIAQQPFQTAQQGQPSSPEPQIAAEMHEAGLPVSPFD
jgi:hypothetical protein